MIIVKNRTIVLSRIWDRKEIEIEKKKKERFEIYSVRNVSINAFFSRVIYEFDFLFSNMREECKSKEMVKYLGGKKMMRRNVVISIRSRTIG